MSLRQKQCGDKIKYHSMHCARNAAYLIGMVYGAAFNAYQCEFCGKYHIGHKNLEWEKRNGIK